MPAVSSPVTLTQHLQDLRVGNKYRIGRKIGSGSFGDIYLGKMASRSKYLKTGLTPHAQAPTSFPEKRLLSSSKASKPNTLNSNMKPVSTSL
jgi:hypothetical protein